MSYNNNGGVNNALKYFNDKADDRLKSSAVGGESGPPKWGPWSTKAKKRRRKKKQERNRRRNSGKAGCSQNGPGLVKR